MKVAILAASLALMVAECSSVSENQTLAPITSEQVRVASSDALAFLGEGSVVNLVCGRSIGRGFYLNQVEKGFVEGGMDNGVTVFGADSEGQPQLAFRDALQEMMVPTKEGAVIKVYPQTRSPEATYIVDYQNGVVETFVIGRAANGDIYNIWTSNKPNNILLPRGNVFVSRCQAVN